MCPEEKDKILIGESKLSETPKKPQYPVTKTRFVYDDAGNSQHEINKKLWKAFQNQIVTSGTTTIGPDGYWYVDGVKTDIKAIGVPGRDGKDGKDGAAGADGKDGVDGKDGINGKDGKDADIWTIGADDFWYVNGRKTIFKSRGEDGKSPLLRISIDGQSLEISSDGGQTWLPFEKNFNKLRVIGYVDSIAQLPKNALVGDIYGVWNPDVYSGRVDEEGHLIKGAYDLYINTIKDWEEDYTITKVYDYDTELPSYATNGTTVLVPVDYLTLDKVKIDGYKVYRFSLEKNGWVMILNTAEIYAGKDDIINYGDNVYALVQGDEEHTYKLYRRVVGWAFFGTNASITYQLIQDVNEGTKTNIPSGKAVKDAYGYYIESPEFVRVYFDSEDKILWGIKTDGTVYYGAGVPPQVKEYIDNAVAGLIPQVEKIIEFLDGIQDGDKTLQELLDIKVDKEEGKGLVDLDFANGFWYEENPEFVEVRLDSKENITEATRINGVKVLPAGVEFGSNTITPKSNPEYLEITTDGNDKIINSVDKELEDIRYGGINISEMKRDADCDVLQCGYDADRFDIYTIENNDSTITMEVDDDWNVYEVKDSKHTAEIIMEDTGEVYLEQTIKEI